MAVTTGPVYIAAPNRPPERYGLFSVATGPLDLDVHAAGGGYQYQVAYCELPVGYENECQATLNEKDFTSGPTTIDGTPFWILATQTCSPVGVNEEEVRRFTLQRLLSGEQAAVERVFSDGSVGQTPSLANNPDAVTLAASGDVVEAFGLLEEWLYSNFGPAGVIHVPAFATSYVKANHLVEREGSVWRTVMGTAVSFGNYSGADPTGTPPAAGTTNVYATGPVAIWRGQPELSPYRQIIDRTANQWYMVAERPYVVAFDCLVAATTTTLVTP